MIDPKYLSEFSDGQIARLKAKIAAADPRTLHILDGLDQPARLKYLLASSEVARREVTRDFWAAKFKDGSNFLAFSTCIPVVVLAGMAAYPGVPLQPGEAKMLMTFAGALGGAALTLNRAKDWAADKVSTVLEKRAAKFTPQALVPMLPAANLSEAQVGNFASLAGRMRKASPKEREIFGIVGRLVSASVAANVNNTQPDMEKQEQHLQELRKKLTQLRRSDPIGARECELRLSESLAAYGMQLLPAPKKEASLRRKASGVALGA